MDPQTQPTQNSRSSASSDVNDPLLSLCRRAQLSCRPRLGQVVVNEKFKLRLEHSSPVVFKRDIFRLLFYYINSS